VTRRAKRGYRRQPFTPADEEPLLARAVPVSKQLARYRAQSGRRDILAGLTVAAVALPSGMAYAEVAGLSPVHGLYALLLPSVTYALLGSSRQVIVGPEGALSALIAAAILPLGAAGSPRGRVPRDPGGGVSGGALLPDRQGRGGFARVAPSLVAISAVAVPTLT
jgi:MFS superfamily sulfate permease-like transporter